MSERIRVGIFPADDGGCGYYRMRWPWEAVAQQFGDEIEVVWDEDVHKQIILEWDRRFDDEPTEYHIPQRIIDMPHFDAMVFQRPLHSKLAPYFRMLRERGIAVIVDLDDNFDRIPTSNVAWHGSEPHWVQQEELKQLARLFKHVDVTKKTSDGHFFYTPQHMGSVNKRNVHAALKHTDVLIASTPGLASHYGGIADTTTVIRNYVNEWYLELGYAHQEGDIPVVGWTGSLLTHPNDLQEMGPSLANLRREGVDYLWKIIGTGAGVKHVCGVMPDVTSGGWVSLHGDYQREYATFEIGVCPLEDNEFNRGKSWLKPLEAAALGVVPVMSALPEYLELHECGIGFIAKKTSRWKSCLRTLLTSDAERKEMREAGLVAASELTYQKNAWRWVEALNLALTRMEAHAS
jgi:glycosyltransferase involved in cell wall biosynthesis